MKTAKTNRSPRGQMTKSERDTGRTTERLTKNTKKKEGRTVEKVLGGLGGGVFNNKERACVRRKPIKT